MGRHADELDRSDPLAPLRRRFDLPEGVVYLDGNSLGAAQPEALEAAVGAAHRWRDELIGGWNAGWVDLPQRTAARIAPLVGARPHEVAVADSTSANLFKALVAALGLVPDRRVVLTVEGEFPTDRYVAGGVADLAGAEVRTVPGPELARHLGPDVAVLLRSHVDYRTGERSDLRAWTRQAHDVGAVTVWDLSHSVGALDLRLGAWGVDLAVGCSYKYLSGGPGAPAWILAAERHHPRLATALRGWFGHADPFAFAADYAPAPDARRFQDGTPPILSLAALHAALAVFDGLDLGVVEAKAASLTGLFVDLVGDRCPGLEVATPRTAGSRGAQVSLRHEHAHAVVRALAGRGVVADHRPPDLLRFGFAPLYVRHTDVERAVDVLADLLRTDAWDRPEHHRRSHVP